MNALSRFGETSGYANAEMGMESVKRELVIVYWLGQNLSTFMYGGTFDTKLQKLNWKLDLQAKVIPESKWSCGFKSEIKRECVPHSQIQPVGAEAFSFEECNLKYLVASLDLWKKFWESLKAKFAASSCSGKVLLTGAEMSASKSKPKCPPLNKLPIKNQSNPLNFSSKNRKITCKLRSWFSAVENNKDGS